MLDAIILGLGAMGSAAAHELARRGRRVLGLEQFSLAHEQGSSHGASRIIRMAYYEDPAYVPLLRRSYELWEQLERDAEARLLHITGGLMLGAPGCELVRGSLASARQHDLEHEVLEADEVHRRYPPFTPEPGEVGVFDPRAGFLDPEQCVRTLASEAARHGAELHWEERVEAWSVDEAGGCVRVRTARGAYAAERLLLCGGAWMPQLLAGLLPLTPTRQVMAWFAPRADPEAFAPERFPIYIWQPDEGLAFYGFPATGGPEAGVKIARHCVPDTCTPETIGRTVTEADIEAIRVRMRRGLPSLDGRLLSAKTCMYTVTPDAHFVLGEHPRQPRVLLAGGFSGHGFKFAPVVGEMLADLATGGTRHLPVAIFSPRRFGRRSEE